MSVRSSRNLLRALIPLQTSSCRNVAQTNNFPKPGQSRFISSSFTSRGFVSQNLKKNITVSEDSCGKIIHTSRQQSFDDDFPAINKKETKVVIREPEQTTAGRRDTGNTRPLVLLFGWGGASHKNLGKYADIYLEAGATTAQYVLPSRHVIRDTAQVPRLMDHVLRRLEAVNIYQRPVYIHCLSDTGIMCYQGMMVSNAESSRMEKIRIRGVVWDSCPGPRPEITAPRVAALMLVNYFCCRRDKMTVRDSAHSSYRLLMDRGYPGLIAKWRGEEVTLSLIKGIWSGHWGRDHHKLYPAVSELFLYSNSDFYLPARYLEQTVLAARDAEGASYTAVKFGGSAHVAHLRKHKAEYRRHVRQFIDAKTEEDEIKEEKKTFLHSEPFPTSFTSP